MQVLNGKSEEKCNFRSKGVKERWSKGEERNSARKLAVEVRTAGRKDHEYIDKLSTSRTNDTNKPAGGAWSLGGRCQNQILAKETKNSGVSQMPETAKKRYPIVSGERENDMATYRHADISKDNSERNGVTNDVTGEKNEAILFYT